MTALTHAQATGSAKNDSPISGARSDIKSLDKATDVKPVHQTNSGDNFWYRLKNLKLGFELWEILTAFTLALTLASMLLWFSSLQPGQVQDEFIWQDQAKNRLHSISIQVNNINGSELRAISLLPSDSVCSNLELDQEINKDLYEKQKSKLSGLNKDLEELQNEANNRNGYLDSTPKFADVADGFTTEINQADGFLEKKLYISWQILELRKTRNSWCDEKKLIVKQQDIELFAEFNSELENLSTEKSRELLVVTTKTKTILETIYKKSSSFTPDLKNQLIENYKSLWSLQSVQQLTEFDKVQDTQSRGRLLDYETWQKKYTEKNPKLRSKIVFISDSK